MTPRDASVFTPSGTRKQMFGSLVFQAVQSENHPVLSEGNPLPEHIRWSHPIRYPDPLIKPNDTIKLDLEENKVVEFIKSDVGKVVMVTGGRNRGRVGVIKNRINKLTIIEEARKRLSAQQAA
ncbi:BnaAnng13180D [Brassica napus]|uniref:BnaAnng13180D protein n=2 Tax=Brassica TaxID=3705 RepID=A0A078IYP3_BRANA|nr:BnaAnng13180D [Brassica napus]VDC70027.1 unnamed protein product [Brassica rapa]